MTTQSFTTPIPNLNGSSREELTALEGAVLAAAEALATALQAAFPHGRDFQLSHPSDYSQSRAEAMTELIALQQIVERHRAIAAAVMA